MNRQPIIIAICLLILVFLAVFVSYKAKKNRSNTQSIPLISPTKIQIDARNTGIRLDISEKDKKSSLQKTALMRQLPYKTNNFIVSFNYADDKFVVTLSEPKEKNKSLFINWLKNNYPALTLTEFVIK